MPWTSASGPLGLCLVSFCWGRIPAADTRVQGLSAVTEASLKRLEANYDGNGKSLLIHRRYLTLTILPW